MLQKTDKIYLSCVDHTVSNEKFDLVFNESSNILITTPQPAESKLSTYYESDKYISHTDASKKPLDKIYQLVKRCMLRRKAKILNDFNISSEKKLLDIGAGTGDFLATAKKKDWKINGVEPNKNARKIAENKDISLHNKLEEVEGKYSAITLWHVLEHLPELENQILKIQSLIQKDGTLIIAVPNFKSYDAQFYKEFWAAYDVPRHLWHFSPEGLEKLLAKFNFELKKKLPLKFDAYYVSLLSEKYLSSSNKINFLRALKIASISNTKARKNNNYSSLIYIFRQKN